MNPDTLLVALHARGIHLMPEGTAIRFEGPKGAMTEPLAAALSRHKLLIITVYATLRKRACDRPWETVRGWIADSPAGPVPPPVIAAGQKLGLRYEEREWPPAYHGRLRMALRVHGLLLAFGDPPGEMDEAECDSAPEGSVQHAADVA